MATLQLVINTVLHEGFGRGVGAGYLRREHSDAPPAEAQMNSYDVLLKNTISYENNTDNVTLSSLQESINNLQSQISSLESKAGKYADDPRFFPFVIRDSRHLTPIQIDPDFHVFDYVDLTQAKQPKSKHSVLMHNARIVVDEDVDAKLALENVKKRRYAEKHEAPCQKYSIECYALKILQVFSYVLRKFPSVEYYFYVEADNSLCVPMTMVRDLALTEERYFINTGIGFSGWIMSRDFLADFIELYQNKTRGKLDAATRKKAIPVASAKNDTQEKPPDEIRPDVLASYYLTDKHAWTVTRQYWVSHTTLESLGTASLSVKDRRKEESGERMKLDKHLPRCLEPRRGKWKVSRRRPYIDPRDRFGWDYFDYEVCPDQVLFPCGGPDQLKELVAEDWRIANETGALERWALLEEKRRKKEAKDAEKRRKEETEGETNKKPDLEEREAHVAAHERERLERDKDERSFDQILDAVPRRSRKPWQRWKNGVGLQDT